jgi:hypothetical protein
MTALLALWAKEPVRIVGFVTAFLAVASVFGLPITADQQTKIIEAVVAALFLLGTAELTRSQVSSPATVAKLVDMIPGGQAAVDVNAALTP